MGATNIEAFKADLGKLQEKFKLSKRTVMQKVSIDLWNGLTQRTPVDTGRARANWNLTEGEPSGELNEFKGAKTGDIPPPEAPDADQITGDAPVYLVNNISYIKYLDEGSSAQSPAGIREPAMQSVAARIEAAIGNQNE